MYNKFKLFLPKSNIDIDIEIYSLNDNSSIHDTFYFLDGQNTFYDKYATYKRSLRAKKYIDYAYKKYNKNILGVALYSSNRENMYATFLYDNKIYKNKKNKVSICKNFCYDLKNTIIPYIESNYNVYKSYKNRFIYGSSLAATTSIYLLYNKYNYFNYAASFSTATFLYHDNFYDYLNKHYKNNKNIFLYVGSHEVSDSIMDKNLYLSCSNELNNYLLNKGANIKYIIDDNGVHNEASWEKYIKKYIDYIYKK